MSALTSIIREQFTDASIMEAASAIVLEKILKTQVILTPDDTKNLLRFKLAAEEREHFGVVFLNARNRVIAFEIMFSGTITQTSIYPREVIKRALALNASAVIFGHNHPSGDVQPSQADKSLTKQLEEVCRLIDVRVLDHVIVSPSDTYSFAENALI